LKETDVNKMTAGSQLLKSMNMEQIYKPLEVFYVVKCHVKWFLKLICK